MPKTSFVLTAIILYWLYLWRTRRHGGPTLTAGASTGTGGGQVDTSHPFPTITPFQPGKVPVLPSVFGSGLPFGTPGINGGYQ